MAASNRPGGIDAGDQWQAASDTRMPGRSECVLVVERRKSNSHDEFARSRFAQRTLGNGCSDISLRVFFGNEAAVFQVWEGIHGGEFELESRGTAREFKANPAWFYVISV